MTEATVLSAFLTQLRKKLPEAVVVKHHDASFIGLPDVSVTYRKRAFWFEAKLIPASEFNVLARVQARVRSSVTQHALMQRLAHAGTAWYIVWERKTSVHFYHPRTEDLWTAPSTPSAVDWAILMMEEAI